MAVNSVIELKAITKSFQMGREQIRALKTISLKIRENDFVSITGPSGSGKSTLMNILGLLDQPNTGQYLLAGNAVEKLPDDERAKLRNQLIGFIFQTFNLLPRASALRNVEMPLVYSASYDRHYSAQKIREMAVESLARVGLADRVDHKPNELSGGERQRVAIARAMVNRPLLLLADEPTGNLDSKTGNEILQIFEKLHDEGSTIIMVTHDPKIASRAHRRITILDGAIAEDTNAVS
ncbi:MAG: macrolide ABC transporter ATP-binding protein [Bdellovibrionales bacterium RIFOXYC1_FULL_54_43]|nr:MAG: macrolide ABC transporter ATP-binding protein [Bdellovibrionales bacterium RIFOXYC1_FULL_54_43]OFZ81102.1 MAG: macrolide ABC transporter ATP-binding protein [Bdellovibrionales bacterium RIFOXYD1_FULL_55_31]